MSSSTLKEYVKLAQSVIEEILENNKEVLLRPPLNGEYSRLQDKIARLEGSLTLSPFKKLGESEYNRFLNFYFHKLPDRGFYNFATLVSEIFYLSERLDLIMSAFYMPDIWAYHLRQILEISAYLCKIIDESLESSQDKVLEDIEYKAWKYVEHKKKLRKYIRESFGEDYKNIHDKLSKYVHVKITPSRFRTLMEKFKGVRSFKEYMLAKTFMMYPTDDESLGLIREEMKEFEEYVEKLAEALETKFLPKLIELYEQLKDKL